METALYSYSDGSWKVHPKSDSLKGMDAQLVLCFGAKHLLEQAEMFSAIKSRFPAAHIVSCSTAGEIYQTSVLDNSISVVAIRFSSTPIVTRSVQITDYNDSYEAGKQLLEQLPGEALRYVLLLSDGGKVNGSEISRAINDFIPPGVLVTGGLAGDGSEFVSTVAGLNEAPTPGNVIAIGFYGNSLRVTHGTKGGWEMFGLEKEVTSSKGNILYEVNGSNALQLYRNYLGSEADHLPGSALLFPLAVQLTGVSEPVVRTILSIDDNAGSMTFAGDIPVGSKVRFMKANFDKLTGAASDAASQVAGHSVPKLALIISCVGRKLILQSRTEEEVEIVDELFGGKTLLTGFYSYGELSPLPAENSCQLHNQTITITGFYES